MAFSYRGSVAVVTGASSGIGAAIALDLAAHGTTVVAAARRRHELQAVVDQCRAGAPSSEAVVCDVSDRAQAEGLVRDAIGRHGRIDLLVNNAGITMRIHATRLTPEDVEEVMRVNFFGTVWTTLAVLPSMLERRAGHIVNIASVAGRIPSAREAAYTASKHAIAGWTDALAADLSGTGVKVHVVNPGPIEAEIWNKLQEPAAYRGKLYPPDRIAAAVRDCIEHDKHERWFPRSLAALQLFRMVAPRTFTRGLGWFDRRADGRPRQGE